MWIRFDRKSFFFNFCWFRVRLAFSILSTHPALLAVSADDSDFFKRLKND